MSTYTLIYNPDALQEYIDAINYYGEESIAVAERFVVGVREKIALIIANPYQYKASYKEYREVSLHDFPYAIVYKVNDETKLVVITAMFHHKRSPKKKYRK